MLSLKRSVSCLSVSLAGHVRGFRRDQRGSISILGATFIALLLGLGTAALKVGDSYVAKLREYRTADVAAHAIANAQAGGGGPQAIADLMSKMNGTQLGLITIFVRNGRIVYHFPCGIEIEI